MQYGTVFYEELDVMDQRAALMHFYHSTGGPYWAASLVSAAQLEHFQLLVEELEQAGYELADQTSNAAAISSDLVDDLSNLPNLSLDCAVQQWLTFGQLLLKQEWGSNTSYCHWYGISCCKTSVSRLVDRDVVVMQVGLQIGICKVTFDSVQGDVLNQYCTDPQSVASIILPGVVLTSPATVVSEATQSCLIQTMMHQMFIVAWVCASAIAVFYATHLSPQHSIRNTHCFPPMLLICFLWQQV